MDIVDFSERQFGALREMQSLLQCSWCNNTLVRPRLMPCSHAYCTDCAKEAVDNKNGCVICGNPTFYKSCLESVQLANIAAATVQLVKLVESSKNAPAPVTAGSRKQRGGVKAQLKDKPVTLEVRNSNEHESVDRAVPAGQGSVLSSEKRSSLFDPAAASIGDAGVKRASELPSSAADAVQVRQRADAAATAVVSVCAAELQLQVAATAGTNASLSGGSVIRRSSRISSSSCTPAESVLSAPSAAASAPARRTEAVRRAVFMGTSLTQPDKEALSMVLKMLSAAGSSPLYSEIFEASGPPTHVVTAVIPPGDSTLSGPAAGLRVCKRTLKVIQGMLCGAWIVSSEWLHESVRAGRVLPEEGFEVQADMKSLPCIADWGGPRKARQQVLEHGALRLFETFQVFLAGPYDKISRDELAGLLSLGGAEVLDTPPLSHSIAPAAPGKRIVLLTSGTALNSRPELFRFAGVASILDTAWVMDSVSALRALPLEDFEWSATSGSIKGGRHAAGHARR